MTYSLYILIGWLVDKVHASVIDNTGLDENPAIRSMWNQICSTLPFCNDAEVAPELIATKIINTIFNVVVVVAVLVLIYTGIKMMTAMGDPEAVGMAKKTLIYVGAGIFLLLIAQQIILAVTTMVVPLLVGE